jgi:hypothetical protein
MTAYSRLETTCAVVVEAFIARRKPAAVKAMAWGRMMPAGW